MRLKRLELSGFKSFPDKTTIPFERDITAVVGPNGSGKSNISDAIRWVLGEQSVKNLRGGKMEDVIFDGTASRKPLGAASVSLSFDNRDRTLLVDNDEVTVTRKYDRFGESEYQLNGASVRLKDLTELFMDTGLGRDGYALIGQGKISEIVSAKSKERREIFEEAAGISKYRYRKAEAQRRLEQAEANLLRLYDILSELESRLAPLEEQSKKAKAFLELSQERKSLEISLWIDTLNREEETLKKGEREYLAAKEEEEQLERKIGETEKEIQDLYDQMNRHLSESEEYRKFQDNLNAAALELRSKAAVAENDLAHHLETLQSLEQSASKREQEAAQMEQDILEAADRYQKLETRKKQAKKEQEALESQLFSLFEESKTADGKRKELEKKRSEAALDRSREELLALSLKEREREAQARLRQAEADMASFEEQWKTAEQKEKEILEIRKEIAEKKRSLENALKGYELKQKKREGEVSEAKAQGEQKQLEIREMEQRAKLLVDLDAAMEGFSGSVKAVVRAKNNRILSGIFGPVSELISVEEPYALAIETALGAALQNIVVQDERSAKSAIRFLKEQKAGRATFLPLTSVKGRLSEPDGVSNEEGYVETASRLVRCEETYRGVVDFLLGRIVIAEDLDAASVIAKKYGYRFRIVTLDGQQINVGGSFTGGSPLRNQGILSRKNEAAKLIRQSEKEKEGYKALVERYQKLRDDLETMRAEYEALRSEQIQLDQDDIRFGGEEARLSEEKARLLSLLTEAKKQKEEEEKESLLRKKRIEEATAAAASYQAKEEELIREMGIHEETLRRQETEREQQLEKRNQSGQRLIELQKDMERQQEEIDRLLREKEAFLSGNRDLEAKKASLQVLIEEGRLAKQRFLEEEKSYFSRIAEYKQKSEDALFKRMEAEKAAVNKREDSKALGLQRESAKETLIRLDEKRLSAQKNFDQLVLRLWEDYELTKSEAVSLAQPVSNRSEMNRRLGSVRNKIKALGTVNVAAVEEYEEVSERYGFLSKQVEDAAQSKKELLELIRTLTEDMQRLFLESFQEINRHFGTIFSELFGGGKGELILSEPEDVLNSGVEIRVQPPGKIIKNLSALSGGEQTFVAIAIYFAILKVRPSPFCVLDEIEAALDDVNVERFASYIRNICHDTQFILITHRRGTMEEADMLYGVTMQEQGVSKLLKLDTKDEAVVWSKA